MSAMKSRDEQIEELAKILGHIEVPAQGAYPPIDIEFVVPMERVAEHLYDERGLRVVESEPTPEVEEMTPINVWKEEDTSGE